ncbi:serine hydrolase [Microbacterium sp. NPDC056234]|uniref:serine hydrolase n=1 Tax=Microbacterium sp. NPDC056234 TaxID=3345757 RepID=UPI0035DD5A6C
MAELATLGPRFAEILAEYQVPGAAVGVRHHGEVTVFGFGVQDIATETPVTSDTLFQIGSLTKTWTALAFLQLVDEGDVDLDAPVRTYLPGFRVADPDVSARVTARHLLNHTSGIEEDFGDPGDGDDVYARMIQAIADAPQVSALGSVHGYSAALGYAILARIMEVVDARPWDAVMADRVFGPMGLSATNARPVPIESGHAARGHLVPSLDARPLRTPIDDLPRAYAPSGGITSTAQETLALAHVLLRGGVAPNGHRILSAERIREMTASRVPVPDPHLLGQEWGLGLVISEWDGQTVYGHDGSTIGQNARLRILPEHDLALVLLSNGDPRDSLYRRVFDVVLVELDAGRMPSPPQPDPDLVLEPDRYVGVYERPGARFEVTAEGGRLRLSLDVDPFQASIMGMPDRVAHDLLPISETQFLLPPAYGLEEAQTAALIDFRDGRASYLHTNARLHPRLASS